VVHPSFDGRKALHQSMSLCHALNAHGESQRNGRQQASLCGPRDISLR
jgi:hypothetical protein